DFHLALQLSPRAGGWQRVSDYRPLSAQCCEFDPRGWGRQADVGQVVGRNRRHRRVLFQADEWRAQLAEKRADLPANHEVFRWRLQRPQRIIDTPRQGPPRSIFYLLSKSSWPIVGFLISVPCGDIVRLLNVLMRERPAFGGCRHDQERRAPDAAKFAARTIRFHTFVPSIPVVQRNKKYASVAVAVLL